MKKKNEIKVGVFDSGIGGLTVLRECVRLLPEVSFCYYGDNENAPYGSKSKEEIFSLTKRAVEYFYAEGTDAVVIACNTATAVCVDELRKLYSFPIVGIEPALKTAAKSCRKVLVLATPQTARSERLKRLALQFPQCAFTLYGAPRLALSVERKLLYGEDFCLEEQLPEGDFDGVVLGCTHYSFFQGRISTHYRLPVFDGNFGTAKRLLSVLEGKNGGEKKGCLGIIDHRQPPQNNEQMYGNVLNKHEIKIEFVGKSADLNKKIFFSNICFNFL